MKEREKERGKWRKKRKAIARRATDLTARERRRIFFANKLPKGGDWRSTSKTDHGIRNERANHDHGSSWVELKRATSLIVLRAERSRICVPVAAVGQREKAQVSGLRPRGWRGREVRKGKKAKRERAQGGKVECDGGSIDLRGSWRKVESWRKESGWRRRRRRRSVGRRVSIC